MIAYCSPSLKGTSCTAPSSDSVNVAGEVELLGYWRRVHHLEQVGNQFSQMSMAAVETTLPDSRLVYKLCETRRNAPAHSEGEQQPNRNGMTAELNMYATLSSEEPWRRECVVASFLGGA